MKYIKVIVGQGKTFSEASSDIANQITDIINDEDVLTYEISEPFPEDFMDENSRKVCQISIMVQITKDS